MTQMSPQQIVGAQGAHVLDGHIARKSKHEWVLGWQPLDVIALGAVAVAVILALAIAVRSVELGATASTTLLGLVGASAVTAYVGKKGKPDEGKEDKGPAK